MRGLALTLPGVALVALAALGACSRGDRAARDRLFARDEAQGGAAAFDPEHPEAALALDADEVARRIGAFDWSGAAEWSVTRPEGAALHVTEKHALRQAASGEFELRADVDPGLGAHAVTGKHVIWTGGMTYARALPAPFRQRPTDRGRDARRYREDSFGLVRTVAALVGPSLKMAPDGEGELLGRATKRYRFTLGDAVPKDAAAPAPGFQAKDADTALRQGFLAGAAAISAEGAVELDASTGAPLRARLAATFAGPASGKVPGAKVTVVVSSKVTALGGEVKAIAAPPGALPDERKPAGPSAALEAAGLKKRGGERPPDEPTDEGE